MSIMSLRVFMSIALFIKFHLFFHSTTHHLKLKVFGHTVILSQSSAESSPKDRQLARAREHTPLHCYRPYRLCDNFTKT
jgi:hypothetical protein